MKISLKWLNDFVDIQDMFPKVQELADLLTRAGLEVEEIKDLSADFKNVVVGHIKVKDKHPNADKLSLCQVEVAPGSISQIVCGAQNHKAGDKVIVALPGAILPGNFAIKKSKIRDVESLGMLCSYKELGLADTSDGIVILDAAAPVGQAFAEYSGYDDVTFELKVTPNRADCLSHYGLAREIGCLLGRPVRQPEKLTKFAAGSTREKIKLEVLNSELCPRYCGRYISGVRITDSPAWLKKRLESIGMNSINNVVDVTNYVMLEMGQPLHAFDAALIAKSQITVRKAEKNEKFKTLKEQELILKGEELVISDGEKPVALAGVIGGLNSGVSEKTQNIFLESASFQAMSVRKSSRMHGVETDSAYRFSRGVDPSSTAQIMDRAALLIQQVAGGEVFDQAYDIYPQPITKKAIEISLQTLSDRLGYPADEKLFIQYMKGLQIDVIQKSAGVYLMTPPLFRFDLECDMDLVEEYARLHGYEHIQETIPALHSGPTFHDLNYMLNQRVSTLLRGEGFSQSFNFAFTSLQEESQWVKKSQVHENSGLKTPEEPIKIKNPLSEELNVMRRALAQGIWKNAVANIRAGNESGALFETGAVFERNGSDYTESRRLALVSWGEKFGLYAVQVPQVYKVRAAIERLFQSLGITAYSFVQNGAEAPVFLHSGQWAQIIVEGDAVGYIGTAHPRWLENEKIRVPVALAELNLDRILKGQPRPLKFKSVPKLQAVERDFAFVMDSHQAVGNLLREAKKSCGAALRELSVFDIYEGDKLAAGQKSVALRAYFQPTDNAFTDADIQQLSQKLIESAQKSVKAVLR